MRLGTGIVTLAAAAALALPGCVITPELLSTLLKEGPKGLPTPPGGQEVKDYFFPYSATWKLKYKDTKKSSFSLGTFSSEDSTTATVTDEIDSFGGRDARTKSTSVATITTKSGSNTSTRTETTSSKTSYTLNADGSVTSQNEGGEKFTITKEVFTAGTTFKQNNVLFKLTPVGPEPVAASGKTFQDAFKFRVEASSATSSALPTGGEMSIKANMSGTFWVARGVGPVKHDLTGTIQVSGAATGSGTISDYRELENATP
ncbi:MAG: hypothetical protein FJZ01_12405 [Candidatus Sericytochromatia bacterium]|nr:hypothetical protein [Candidatus Tanganyikabacteria bacterium]